MLKPFISKYGERQEGEPKRLDKALLVKRKQGGFDMLRDFHDLWLLVNESMMSLIVLEQAARGLRDENCSILSRTCKIATSANWLGSKRESSRLLRRSWLCPFKSSASPSCNVFRS